MNNKLNFTSSLFVALLFLTLPGCAIGPLISNETARTVGADTNELIAGYGQAGYVVKLNYGIEEDLDIGFQMESLSIGVRLKKAFVQSQEGWSFAGALGLGSSVGGSHYYGDLLASRMFGAWEPYGTIRIVHVENDPTSWGDGQGSTYFTTSASSWNYGMAVLGTRYWFSPKLMFIVEGSTLLNITSETTIVSSGIFGASLGFRF